MNTVYRSRERLALLDIVQVALSDIVVSSNMAIWLEVDHSIAHFDAVDLHIRYHRTSDPPSRSSDFCMGIPLISDLYLLSILKSSRIARSFGALRSVSYKRSSPLECLFWLDSSSTRPPTSASGRLCSLPNRGLRNTIPKMISTAHKQMPHTQRSRCVLR